MRAKNSHAQRKTLMSTTILLGVPSSHPQQCSPQDFHLSECAWRTYRIGLLRIYLLNERTMLQGQTKGKTQDRAKGLTFKVLLCPISSICFSSPPSSTLLFSPFPLIPKSLTYMDCISGIPCPFGFYLKAIT